MNSSPDICVDASFIVTLLVPEATSEVAEEHWQRWHKEGRAICAPTLLSYEVTNSLHRCVLAGRLTSAAARRTVESVIPNLGIDLVDSRPSISLRALEIASEFGLKAAYDAHYVAVAELQEAELWTLDERLVRRVEAKLPWVRLLGAR